MDYLTPAQRSALMSRIGGKNTAPELAVRRLVWNMGFRYRLHRADLPGKPDLVFAGRGRVVFVHGCFWHWHRPCPKFSLPKSRTEFWIPKLEGNRRRDRRNALLLRRGGWKVLVVWECEMRRPARLARKLGRFLKGGNVTPRSGLGPAAQAAGTAKRASTSPSRTAPL